MGLFNKKTIDIAALDNFWKWFEGKEEWIKANINTNGIDVVWAIDEQIKPIFPYFKKELEFQLGYNNGVGEFFFFHFNDINLKKDAEIFKNAIPEDLAKRWSIVLDA